MTTPVFRPGTPGLIPDAWVIKADKANATAPVVAVHGIRREVEEMAHLLAPRAMDTGRTVILPHFSKSHWTRYQRAACPKRSDKALLSLMQSLLADGTVASGPFDLAGFSGGAQFAHRFAWMYPQAVGRLCATAPGWWTFPDVDAAWPYGLEVPGHRRGVAAIWLQANLKRFLDREIVVTVGSDDIQRDRNLRTGVLIDAQQGVNRVERAQNWVRAMEKAAQNRGLNANITFKVLRGVGHSFSTCVTRAHLDELFIKPANACAGCQFRHLCLKNQPNDVLERSAA